MKRRKKRSTRRCLSAAGTAEGRLSSTPSSTSASFSELWKRNSWIIEYRGVISLSLSRLAGK